MKMVMSRKIMKIMSRAKIGMMSRCFVSASASNTGKYRSKTTPSSVPYFTHRALLKPGTKLTSSGPCRDDDRCVNSDADCSTSTSMTVHNDDEKEDVVLPIAFDERRNTLCLITKMTPARSSGSHAEMKPVLLRAKSVREFIDSRRRGGGGGGRGEHPEREILPMGSFRSVLSSSPMAPSSRIGVSALACTRDDDDELLDIVGNYDEQEDDVDNRRSYDRHQERRRERREWISTRSLLTSGMTQSDVEMLAMASSFVSYHTASQYCGICGSKTVLPTKRDGSRVSERVCSNPSCGETIYPRIDPVVITLVCCGDWCLLGHNKRWTPGRYSLLAGFIELGESVETAIRREVYEEAGVHVGEDAHVTFIESQPWPFPRSLMLGYICSIAPTTLEATAGTASLGGYSIEAPPGETECIDGELGDARWFHRKWLEAAMCGHNPQLPDSIEAFTVPGSYSLSRSILDVFVSSPPAEIAREGEEDAWLDEVEDVVIDDFGTFKYVLIRVTDTNSGANKLVVRGSARFDYHNEVFKHAEALCEYVGGSGGGVSMEALGGGRIERTSSTMRIYGFSYAFGQADHRVSAVVLRRVFPLHDMSVSFDGY